MLLAACGDAGRELVTESSTELEVTEAAQPELRKSLEAGRWLIQVRERDIDLRTVVETSRQQFNLLDTVPRHGVVVKVVSLDAPAEIRVRLGSTDHPTRRGRATVQISRFKQATGSGADPLVQGYDAWSAAAGQIALATPESWSAAADKLNEAITWFDEAGDEAAGAAAAYSLATLQYSKRDDNAAAVRAAETAADLFDDVSDETGHHNAGVVRAAAEMNLAAAMNATTQKAEQKAMYDAAGRRLSHAAEYFDRHDLPLRGAYAANLRGMRALNLGDQEAAAAQFSKALELSRGSQDVTEQVRSTSNLAWTHRLQGNIQQAAEEYRSLLPLLDPERQPYLYGVILNNYGFCLIALGEFDEATRLRVEALELFKRLDQKDEVATQLAGLGALYLRVGDTARALDMLRQAIVAQEKASDTRGLASTLRMAANAAAAEGQHDMALEYLRRSAAIDGSPDEIIRTRVLIGGELRILGDLTGAEAELADALQSQVALVRADALAERARINLARRNEKAAIVDLRAADTIYAGLGIEYSRIETTSTLAMLLLATGDMTGASKTADESVAIVRRLRVKSSNPEWRARFQSAQYAPYESRIAVDLAQGNAGGTVNGAWSGFRHADEIRGRSLADQIADRGGRGDSETEAQIARLRDMITDRHVRLDARVQAQADEAGNSELRREIAEATAKLDALQVGREAGAGGSAFLPESLQAVQDQLPPDTLVLAFFVGDRSSHAWLLGKNRLKHASLAGRAQLQRAIDPFVEDPGSQVSRGDQDRLATMLFGDLLEGATEKRLLLIADGPLNAVPFASLPLARNDPALLLDRFVIGYSPSLALAMAPRQRIAHALRRAAVISDPVYAVDDPRFGSGVSRSQRQLPNKGFVRLPYSALEARAVVDNFGAASSQSLAGFDATPERVLELARSDLAVLHFATHAEAVKTSPRRSALHLTEYAPNGALIRENQITADDVMRTGLKAGVVVLSGCDTGNGDALRGEGVLGLTYSFLANGSGAVVASLWKVEDAATAYLMNEFYRAYRASGNAAEALRTAQIRTRANPRAAAVWSSFVVRANGFP